MKNRWDTDEAMQHEGELAQRVYSSRLLGADPALVLHSGGNTSVKIRERNIFGEYEEILYVKGSGWDLKTIKPAGFAPLRRQPVLRLAELPELSDIVMARELRKALTDPSAPSPSVEAILHASIPHRFVDHTHADAVIAVTNTSRGEEFITEIFGGEVVVVPYVMPGFLLAKLCADEYVGRIEDGTLGMILLNHGAFTFGDTAQEAYNRMIRLVTLCEDFLKRRGAWNIRLEPSRQSGNPLRNDLASLRSEVSRAAGKPMLLRTNREEHALAFCQRTDLDVLTQSGPATPDHVIRTKRVPLIGRRVDTFVTDYRNYFSEHSAGLAATATMLDPAPRVILDSELGLVSIGADAAGAVVVEDIYLHTIDIIQRADALDAYQALPADEIFKVEYWELEQAKLKSSRDVPAFTGEVAVVTGAASGIGKACASSLLARGAAVVGLDIDPAVTDAFTGPSWLGITCDITSAEAVEDALEQTVRAFGGVDMLILNAGIFPEARALSELDPAAWRRVQQVNVDANQQLLRATHPLLSLAPNSGRVVVIGSKNVQAPGPGAGAYSASKAALTQLARVAALEWAADGIRVNVLHPNAVFDTALWTDELLAARAAHYGLTVDQYKRSNLLKVEVTSAHVGELAAELCGPAFACTTGAQIPVDGGNERVI